MVLDGLSPGGKRVGLARPGGSRTMSRHLLVVCGVSSRSAYQTMKLRPALTLCTINWICAASLLSPLSL